METTNAKVVKISEIGQSAAESLNGKPQEKGSETVHDMAATDSAVANDTVQTTTERASES